MTAKALEAESKDSGKSIPPSEKKFDIAYSTSSTRKVQDLFCSSETGLSSREAKKRLEIYGRNEVAKKRKSRLLMFLEKFTNPLIVVLIVVSILSFNFGQELSAGIIIGMVLISSILSFVQEYKAGNEVEKLQELVRTTAAVFRDLQLKEIPMWEIVPGDIISLSAGDLVPADLRIISCKDLFLNQASLTGEAFPVEKTNKPLSAKDAPQSENIVFMGSNVVSGSGFGLVLLTGANTQYGDLAKRVAEASEITSFDKGINDFTRMMIKFMIVLVVAIFLINSILKNDLFGALLFSLAIAVGLTPEMLPVIITVNLAQGAKDLSKKKVIVKRLSAMQNFGSIDVLCSDKTGTLTLGEVILEKHLDADGNESADVLFLAYMNSYYHTGLNNLLDKAILKHSHLDASAAKKIDEIPFDFQRKMMSVIIDRKGRHTLIAKGAPDEILKRCKKYESKGKLISLEKSIPKEIGNLPDEMRLRGFRVLAVAYREFSSKKKAYSKADEQGMVLKGFMLFLDPPKPSAKAVINELENLKIEFKVLTGDNELVTEEVCRVVGMKTKGTLTGEQVEKLGDIALQQAVENNTIFARLTPMQKEKVIAALKRNGHTVGYMGDGINDAQALKGADVGISVNNATDIAKESADIILLHKSLEALKDGVVDGRRVFGNITKYVRMGSSSNFGNMISFTGASIFLPFLPMTSAQILVNNFLYDVSQLAISTDNVDKEYGLTPHPWNIKGIERFMLYIGPVSSVFDFLTFGMLLFFQVPAEIFRTGWFLESLCTQTLAIHVIRTGKIPFLESKPSLPLILMSLAIVSVGFILVLTAIGKTFEFVAPPLHVLLSIVGIVLVYLLALYFVKTWYGRKFGYH
ncbi:MAG: magnesium-translocating P-type ATPase [Candidatus Micrarchaeota archaeon]